MITSGQLKHTSPLQCCAQLTTAGLIQSQLKDQSARDHALHAFKTGMAKARRDWWALKKQERGFLACCDCSPTMELLVLGAEFSSISHAMAWNC